jgi:hypothetical protein
LEGGTPITNSYQIFPNSLSFFYKKQGWATILSVFFPYRAFTFCGYRIPTMVRVLFLYVEKQNAVSGTGKLKISRFLNAKANKFRVHSPLQPVSRLISMDLF